VLYIYIYIYIYIYLFYTDVFIFYLEGTKKPCSYYFFTAVILNQKTIHILARKKYSQIKNKLKEKEILQM
jgi:hypothetical protein